ncbi:MAG TPA: hypothetical protein VF971_03965 [Candidatus Limnocylindrales bacterium]
MECSVPVEVRLALESPPTSGRSSGRSAATLAEVGARLWHELVDRLEAALPTPADCEACCGSLKANGRPPRRLLTLSARSRLRRQRYRCTGCGLEVVRLDAALGLEPRVQPHPRVRERGPWLVTEMSYQKAVDVAAELRNWPISPGELLLVVAQNGRALEAARAAGA